MSRFISKVAHFNTFRSEYSFLSVLFSDTCKVPRFAPIQNRFEKRTEDNNRFRAEQEQTFLGFMFHLILKHLRMIYYVYAPHGKVLVACHGHIQYSVYLYLCPKSFETTHHNPRRAFLRHVDIVSYLDSV